ncbi:MAG: carboxylesterase family protein [Solirubrobacteraceae bacterium]|nr:carboxylesterase family protein [Solirubrobacteraceae bacterium]
MGALLESVVVPIGVPVHVRLRQFAVAVAAAVPLAAPPVAGAADAPLSVSTSSGRLHGASTATARVFLGVRFAQPVDGERRWTLPEFAHRATGTVDATKPGPRCAQSAVQAGGSTTEDCLFLNVTTPRGRAKDLPVMVWWHGGGYTSGSGDVYDAQRLADRGRVIVVTPNKRLGIFGYLGLKGLPGSGNFGFADQLAAVRWAKRNARAFGGDPGNITVFGQSDGGMAACALLTAPAARGLVQRVATQSGSCLLRWPASGLLPGTPAQTPYVSVSGNRAVSRAAIKAVGCGDLTCLRRVPTERLLEQSINFSNVLAYGTKLLPREPAKALREGRFLRVPVLSGGTLAEENSFVAGAEAFAPGTYSAETYPESLRTAFGRSAGRVAEAYPVSAYRSPAAAFASVITDASWACLTLAGNRLLAKRTRVYAYEFADPATPNVNGVPTDLVPQGSAHATDVPYLFDLGGERLVAPGRSQRLSDEMIGAWARFARTGAPHAVGSAAWKRFSPGGNRVLQLRPGAAGSVNVSTEHRCDLWETIGK